MPYEKLCIGVATKYNTTHMDEINYFVVGAYDGYTGYIAFDVTHCYFRHLLVCTNK